MEAVAKYEPRIKMEYGDIQFEQDLQVLKIYIQYLILETGEINTYNFEITPDDNPYKYS